MENVKTCSNCKFFSQHYSKQDLSFQTVDCGHCLKRNDKKMRQDNLCENWEISTKKEVRKRLIKEILKDMSGTLNEMALILKDDEKENQ